MGITEPNSTSISGIAVVPPGLEEAAAAELTALGCQAAARLRRAVRFQTDLAGFYRLHLQARLPFRLLLELAQFPCRSKDELYDGVQRAVDWSRWLPPGATFRVDATGSAPGLNHSHYSALQVKNALVDLQRQQWGARSSVDLDDPDLSIHLHLGGGEAALSLDGSGGSMHRRGYRAAMGLAPLKENLAAGLIALTGWDGSVPLADPLCGSGTLLIEAACMALGRAPGLGRRFALERWPKFDSQLWQQERQAASSLALETLPSGEALAPIVGREQDPGVLDQAHSNAEAAGIASALELSLGDCRDFVPPPGPGILVCNPPYGERIGERDALEPLYADLGRMVKERCGGWSLWLLSGNPELTGALKMKASRRIPISNGGIDCRWLHYEVR
ncbi:class I SAM-dependent RNA methyltransferase [Cyanobium sp. WKJ7-Wakatipu]|uniref:THUMP domain-containing class I SAM-dependent RNA methyltransferase n=1 Tax=Cyanobium sp. WKJ7-Wakatipu TaxID=2823726 RepID=UPI0020CDF65C|nr:THUMP domain-containing protein [Cyanobium sp. WKJ7-Wakatipu]MCP9784245.1 class I SAM-dependent RNA methyltransferase [Cyanobium sp. WKJ7-Wakatipu]